MSQQMSLDEFKKSVEEEMMEWYGYLGRGSIQWMLEDIPENVWQELYKGDWDALETAQALLMGY